MGIKAGWGIKAGEGIEAGWGIEAGEGITCKLELNIKLRIFAGLCLWRNPTQEEKTISCGKLTSGSVEYGILKEIGLPRKENDKKNELLKKADELISKAEELKKEAEKL